MGGVRRKAFKYVIIVSFITGMLLPFIFSMMGITYHQLLMPVAVSSYLIYMLIGYYIDSYTLSKSTEYLIFILGIIGFVLHFLGTWIVSYKYNFINNLFKEYLNVPAFLYSTSIFLLFKKIDFNKINKKINDFIKLLTKATFGIYLTHIIAVNSFVGSDIMASIWFRLFAPIAIFVTLEVIILFLRKIPVFKMILP